MGGLNLISLAAHTGWVFSKTLLLHFVDNKSIKEQSVARSRDMTFDTAFHIVKTFLRQSSEGSVEDLQAFCNIFIPSPSWITVVTVKIPPEMADQAAEILLEHIGEETMDTLIGGRTWWRKRARADGCIEGEWISMKRDWNGNDLKEKLKEKSKTSFASESATKEAANHHGEDQYEQSLDEQRCIFYVHGGEKVTMKQYHQLTVLRRILLWQLEHSPIFHLANGSQSWCSSIRSQLPTQSSISFPLRSTRLPCSIPLPHSTSFWSTPQASRSGTPRLCR